MSASRRRKYDNAEGSEDIQEVAAQHAADVAWTKAALDPVDMPQGDWRSLQHEVARYIAAMTAELAAMARPARFDLLVYFLEMAEAEAKAQADKSGELGP